MGTRIFSLNLKKKEDIFGTSDMQDIFTWCLQSLSHVQMVGNCLRINNMQVTPLVIDRQ